VAASRALIRNLRIITAPPADLSPRQCPKPVCLGTGEWQDESVPLPRNHAAGHFAALAELVFRCADRGCAVPDAVPTDLRAAAADE
jgi:hypothetical protein